MASKSPVYNVIAVPIEKIEPNSVVEFTSAPAFFGNGYLMPIVQLSVNGEILLSFEEGYANLLELY